MYSSREVSELVGLSVGQVRRFARAGFLSAERTPQNHYLFTFQDLTFLRTTTALLATDLPKRRVHRALRHLREQHPVNRPLSELAVTAVDQAVVASDGASAWEPESGQVLFEFQVVHYPAGTPVEEDDPDIHHLPDVASTRNAQAWFERGCLEEERSPAAARRAYRRTLSLRPKHLAARVNLGRLLHDAGQVAKAIVQYRKVLAYDSSNATAAHNLGVALEDLGRNHEAFTAYAQAIAADSTCADAHFNIAKLYEQGGDELAAVRHLQIYRELVNQRTI